MLKVPDVLSLHLAKFPQPFDPIGLNNNLPQAEGLIDAELIQGDYFVSHSYSWTEFDIDPETQVLTVTTYGIDRYTEEDVDPENPDNRLEEVLASQPTILSQFTVNPAAAPVVEDQTFTVEENTAIGTLVGTVIATDANENQQDLLTYTIVDGNTDVDGDGTAAFAIDSGAITVSDTDDLQVSQNFALQLTVTDPTGLSDTAIVTINVAEDVNNAPVAEDATFTVAENSAVGTLSLS